VQVIPHGFARAKSRILQEGAPGSATWRRMKQKEVARLPSGATLYTGRGNAQARTRWSASYTTLHLGDSNFPINCLQDL